MYIGISAETLPSLWVVTDQLPYPPRNGITLPIFNYISRLQKSYAIKIIFLNGEKQKFANSDLVANETLFGSIEVIEMSRIGLCKRLLGELTCVEMLQHGWIGKSDLIERCPSPDRVLVSPMSAVAKWRALVGSEYIKLMHHAAAVNDCTTAEYYFRGKTKIGGLTVAIKSLIDRVRSFFIGIIESKLLISYRSVFLQTNRDRELMKKLVGSSISNKVALVPNGVDKKYFDIEYSSEEYLVFVGELSGEYDSIILWLLNEVWPRILFSNPDLKMLIVGRGASIVLRTKIAASSNIMHIEYVDDLSKVYAKGMVAICPVFKGFGLINKTIEAMACGLPVVGGVAAFNGIEGFIPGIHGEVCNNRTAEDFAAKLSGLIRNKVKRREMGSAARVLISKGFDWDVSVASINQSFKSSVA